MKQALWVIQSICPPLDAADLKSACASVGVETTVTECRATDDLPAIVTDRPVLFYGSCRFIRKVVESRRWNPGAYYDEKEHRYSNVLEHWGSRLLNSDAAKMRLGDFSGSELTKEKVLFIRPDKDLKEFSGCVWPVSDFLEFVSKIESSQDRTALDMPIVVARKRQIESEWRLFIVDGRVAAGSRYELYGDLDYSTVIPEKLITFAEETASIWTPSRAFVMDIAFVDSSPFVLEINGINSAGFYRADVTRIVTGILRGISENTLGLF